MLVKGHIAMHHGTYTYGRKPFDFRVVGLPNVLAQVGIAVLQSVPNGIEVIGPQSVDQSVLPFVTSLCNGSVLAVNKDSLNAGRAKLNTEDGLP